ncbi:hypothetical protein CEP51_016781 [Fusarium floridanum]|uniref:Uncharacterized protein n=1 Tax=Fusarium floridanum TaxID=1325733 RepID=A0A428NG45_9HYPO|nr:hypothetical protein CEP51_016781 [Fusarium floridanum]
MKKIPPWANQMLKTAPRIKPLAVQKAPIGPIWTTHPAEGFPSYSAISTTRLSVYQMHMFGVLFGGLLSAYSREPTWYQKQSPSGSLNEGQSEPPMQSSRKFSERRTRVQGS